MFNFLNFFVFFLSFIQLFSLAVTQETTETTNLPDVTPQQFEVTTTEISHKSENETTTDDNIQTVTGNCCSKSLFSGTLPCEDTKNCISCHIGETTQQKFDNGTNKICTPFNCNFTSKFKDSDIKCKPDDTKMKYVSVKCCGESQPEIICLPEEGCESCFTASFSSQIVNGKGTFCNTFNCYRSIFAPKDMKCNIKKAEQENSQNTDKKAQTDVRSFGVQLNFSIVSLIFVIISLIC